MNVPALRYYWFSASHGLGIGVTAPDAGTAWFAANAALHRLPPETTLTGQYIADVDPHALGLGELATSPTLPGVWFPPGEVRPVQLRVAESTEDARSRFVYVMQDGSVREVTAEEAQVLATAFDAGDGARPAVKHHYESRWPDGRLGGFLPRSELPAGLAVRPTEPFVLRLGGFSLRHAQAATAALGDTLEGVHEMQIRLNRVRAILLMAALLPFVAVVRFVRVLRRPKKRVYTGSIDSAPLAYVGDNPILIAVWADWAHIWDVATRGIVEQLRQEFAGRCEFAYVEATSRAVMNAYGVQVVPTLILRHRDADIGRFANVLRPDDVRSAIAAAVAQRSARPDIPHNGEDS